MKIPKYIENLIDEQTRLAERLLSNDIKLCEWLTKHNIDINGDIADCVRLGAVMICEPYVANKVIKNEILKQE